MKNPYNIEIESHTLVLNVSTKSRIVGVMTSIMKYVSERVESVPVNQEHMVSVFNDVIEKSPFSLKFEIEGTYITADYWDGKIKVLIPANSWRHIIIRKKIKEYLNVTESI
jgi:hypothetical protein